MRFIAPVVEETYLEYSRLFRVQFRRRVPFIFYNSHYDFQQQNVLPILVSESTGGFTDLLRGRIVVPFTGEYGSFRHVARHEMVHAFMLEKIQQVMHSKGKYTFSPPPLWFTEGMAEYIADRPQDTQGNMFVRDALIHGRLLDLGNIWRIRGSFMMYKEGEAVLAYIGTNYGEDAIIRILENWWVDPSFEIVVKRTLGVGLAQISRGFFRETRRRYYPMILSRRFATEAGMQLTPPRSFHIHGVGRELANGTVETYSVCARDGALDICRLRRDRSGHTTEKTMIQGGRKSSLESLPAFRSKIEVHGDTLVFVAKSGERDRIYLWNLNRNREFTHVEFDSLGLISSPTLSGDGRRIVFSALDEAGRIDLYWYHFDTRRLERITNDGFSEEDPDYHPTQEKILFSADRGAYGNRDRTHIYEMDLATRKITAIEGGRFADSDPEWAPDGKSFLFVSDREGVFNVYEHHGNAITRQTDVLGGVMSPSFLPDGRSFLGTTYTGGEFHIFQYPHKNGNAVVLAAQSPDSTTRPWSVPGHEHDTYVSHAYTPRFAVDFVGVGLSVDPEAGDVGNGGVIAFTDVLGNHEVHGFFATTTEDLSSIRKSFNAGVTYINRSHRLNFSLGGFSLNSTNPATLEIGDRETRAGGAVGVSYPFDRFHRVDASLLVRKITRSFFDIPLKSSYTGSVFLTWVNDNTLWTIGGPVTGWRYYTTIGRTVDFQNNGFAHTSLQLDLRRYFKLAPRIVWANRFVTQHSFGDDDLVFYLGGPWTLRGYKFRQFAGRSTYLVNTEVRMPLIDHFVLGLPFGAIELPMLRAAVFADAGKTTRNILARNDTDWRGTLGLGVELNFGIAPVIRVNFTRATDFRTIRPDWGTELFIGYNY